MNDASISTYKIRPALKLSFIKEITNFKISTNNEFWGDFDDAIFEIFFENGEEMTIAVQLKHTTQVVRSERLTSTKHDFSLDKYYKSYKKICQNYASDKLKSVQFVLYTIANHHESIEQFEWQRRYLRRLSCASTEFISTAGHCFQFHCEEESFKKQFLAQFFVYTNQMDNTRTTNEIRTFLQTRFPKTEDILDKLLVFVDRWKNGQLGKHYWLTRNEFVSEICELLLSPYVVQPRFDFKPLKHVVLWNKAVESVDVTFVRDVQETAPKIWSMIFEQIMEDGCCRSEWSTPCLSINAINLSVQKRYLLSKAAGYKISVKDFYFVCWKSGLVPLFLDANEIGDEVLAKILKLSKSTSVKKYFVVYTTVKDIDKFYKHFSKFQTLTDLDNSVLRSFLGDICVSIQNKFQKSLQHMYEIDGSFLGKVTTEIFLEIMDNNPVGPVERGSSHIYVGRQISEFHCEVSALSFIRNEIVFILCDLNKHHQMIAARFPNRATEFDGFGTDSLQMEKNIILADYDTPMKQVKSFLAKFKNKYHIFLLIENVAGGLSLKWVESTGPVASLKDHISKENPISDSDLFLFKTNLINVISSPPGMGKSSLINYLSKNYSQGFWVMNVSLLAHSKFLESLDGEPLGYFLSQKCAKNQLTKICFETFLNTGKVIFLFDGFDGLAEKLLKNCLWLFKYLKSKNVITWVTSRPARAAVLEKELFVLPHSISPFSSDNKQTFIDKYMVQHVADNHRKMFYIALGTSIKNLDSHFLDVPLQMYMLCEIVAAAIDRNFLAFRSVDILHLYKSFIKMKLSFFEERHLKGCDDDVKEQLRKSIVLNMQVSSLVAIFGLHPIRNLYFYTSLIQSFFRKIRQGKEKTGIITEINCDNIPIFLHETYAEYFAATWFAKNWKIPIAKNFFIQIYFSENYSMFRLLFDKILSKGIDIFEAVLDQDLEKIDSCSLESLKITDKIGRNVLHLACSCGSKCVDSLLEKGLDPKSGPDNFLAMIPLDYADRRKNVAVIDKILHRTNVDFSHLTISVDIKWLLHECIKKKFITLLSKFTKYLNILHTFTVTSEFDDLLFTAVEANDVGVIKLLLDIKEFRRYIKDMEAPRNAALQLAIVHIADGLVDHSDSEGMPEVRNSVSPYQIAIERSSREIQEILEDAIHQ